MTISPLRFEAEIRKSITAVVNSGTVDKDALIDAVIGAVMREYYYSVDPDNRAESCEECGKYDEDIVMPTKINGKDVCYDCFVDLGGNPDEGE